MSQHMPLSDNQRTQTRKGHKSRRSVVCHSRFSRPEPQSSGILGRRPGTSLWLHMLWLQLACLAETFRVHSFRLRHTSSFMSIPSIPSIPSIHLEPVDFCQLLTISLFLVLALPLFWNMFPVKVQGLLMSFGSFSDLPCARTSPPCATHKTE